MSGYLQKQASVALRVSQGPELLSAWRMFLSDIPMISLLSKIQKEGYAFLESFHSGLSTNDLLALVAMP
jgi:hypothetical protein